MLDHPGPDDVLLLGSESVHEIVIIGFAYGIGQGLNCFIETAQIKRHIHLLLSILLPRAQFLQILRYHLFQSGAFHKLLCQCRS
jgi:hypothetical protein